MAPLKKTLARMLKIQTGIASLNVRSELGSFQKHRRSDNLEWGIFYYLKKYIPNDME